MTVVATDADGATTAVTGTAQVPTEMAVTDVEHGGILHYVLRRTLSSSS